MLDYSWRGNIRELQHTIEKAVIMCENDLIDIHSLHIKSSSEKSNITTSISTLEEVEKAMIISAIDRLDSNMTAIALELGIARQTLYNKIKKYDL